MADDNTTAAPAPPPPPTMTLALCDDCAHTGNCSSPSGDIKYCGTWLNATVTTNSTQNCCCFGYRLCRLEATACSCLYPGEEEEPDRGMAGTTKGLIMLGVIALVCLVVLGVLCCCGCYACQKRDAKRAKQRRSRAANGQVAARQ